MREGCFHVLCFAVLVAALTISIGVPILAAEAAQSNVNIDLKDTDVKSAIEALFRGTGKNYSIDSNVQGTISALSIKDVPFDTALRSLTKSAGLVYRQDAGVYIISVRPDTSQMASTAAAAPTDLASVDPTTAEPELKIEKIPLNNTSATEILAILQGSNNNNNRSYGGYGMGTGTGGMGTGSMGGYGGYGGMSSGYGGYGGMSGGYGGYGGGGYGSGYGNRGGYSGGYGGGYGGGGGGGSSYRGW